MANDLTLLPLLSAPLKADEMPRSFAPWARFLPDVHPFFVDIAHTLDRTVARLERQLRSLQAETTRIEAALDAGCSPAGMQAQQIKQAAFQEAMADYHATIAQCRSQFEAQLARRWTSAEIVSAKRLANGPSGEPVRAA